MDDEMEEMRVEAEAEKAEGRLSVLNLFTFQPLRWQLISIIVLMAGQQLSGVNAVRRAVRGWPVCPAVGGRSQGGVISPAVGLLRYPSNILSQNFRSS